MKRGLVIGKFLPVHKGHVALINFAASQCDELIVSMSFTSSDPIEPGLRLNWLKDIFKNRESIKIASIADDFDGESLPLEERTRIWAEVIRKTYPPVHILVSSEAYSIPFSRHLGAENRLYDVPRSIFPVSATLIRKDPYKHWEFLPEPVRMHFLKRVCFYGPESTGKSVMAERIATLLKTEYVPEVAREFLSVNEFTLQDIESIAIAHHARIEEKSKLANRILVCDTDVITTSIYSRHYLKEEPLLLKVLENSYRYDHYFLFDIDVPWVADGLRDLGHRREEMFGVFKKSLEDRNTPYTLVSGSWKERESIILETLSRLITVPG